MGNKETMMSVKRAFERSTFSVFFMKHVCAGDILALCVTYTFFARCLETLVWGRCHVAAAINTKKNWPLCRLKSAKVWSFLWIFLWTVQLCEQKPTLKYITVYLTCNYSLYSCGGPQGQMGLWHLWSKQALQLQRLKTQHLLRMEYVRWISSSWWQEIKAVSLFFFIFFFFFLNDSFSSRKKKYFCDL